MRLTIASCRSPRSILHLRNDPQDGRVMWTGKRELVWPTKPADGPTAGYAGSEQMHIVGHMVRRVYLGLA